VRESTIKNEGQQAREEEEEEGVGDRRAER
jgi:hypothetical protein